MMETLGYWDGRCLESAGPVGDPWSFLRVHRGGSRGACAIATGVRKVATSVAYVLVYGDVGGCAKRLTAVAYPGAHERNFRTGGLQHPNGLTTQRSPVQSQPP